ncbi:hypothetical protein CDL15_Pgr015682 [Punica granatum]|uniref:RNA helicase n=1 Tax=Punica granatum TaxID=22663 RepID=A0A218XNT1_PUNGR|nr:hypothetical protein CDL15_Pgr015682 [Punica granatum]
MDVICQAKSGMGKTAVFVLSTLQQIEPVAGQVAALVLCHTRELAYQICHEFERFSTYLPDIKVAVFYGGVNIKVHKDLLKNECPHIVVGTPGRILALSREKDLSLKNVRHFILDECDKMLESLDMRRDVQEIFKMTPHDKQPMEIYVDEAKLTLHGLVQHYIKLSEAEKNRKLNDLLDALDFNQVVIFVKSVNRAAELNKLLVDCNFPSICIHSGMSQEERLTRYKGFKEGHKRILVATDLVGRGIDIERVNIVINYDMPDSADTYLHRVGRAGRFGTKGLAITFVSSASDSDILNQVQARFEVDIKELPEQIDTSTYSMFPNALLVRGWLVEVGIADRPVDALLVRGWLAFTCTFFFRQWKKMANKKMKEDERIERAIRSLLKLPENRRCINCNSVGPQYVCTTFWTFICTNCSGIHREFTHRVKSVSIAKFTTDEVSALQAGGNEVNFLARLSTSSDLTNIVFCFPIFLFSLALLEILVKRVRQIYFKEWDPHCNSQPDNSNLYKLRDFIKHVYVDQKFTGEKETEKLPRVRLADKVNSSESRRPSSSRIGLSSPSYEDRYDHHYHSARSGPSPSAKSDDGIVRYYYDESRSPRYTQQSSRTGYRRSPARFEVVDDRFRDDGYGSRRRSTNAMRLMSEDFRVIGRRSFDGLQKNAEKPSISLEARLERELSRQASQSVRSRERIEGKDSQDPSNDQASLAVEKKAPSSPSQGSSSNENKAKEEKVANQGSLIDCGDDSKPPDVQKQQRPPPMATTTTTTNTNTMTTVTAPPAAANNDETNWAPFGSSTEEKKAPTKPSNPNTLEFLLFELAGPAPLPGPSSNEVFSGVDQPTTVQNVIPTTEHNIIVGPSRLPEPESVDATSPASHPNASIQQPLDETSGGSPDDGANLVQFPVSHQYHQPPTSAPAENMSLQEQPIPSAPAENMSIQEQPISSDLFTVLYPQAPAPVRTWQPVPLQGFGFNMHYYPPNMMQLGAYSNSPKSTNPFDVGMEGTEPQRPMFPSTVPMQGALFNNDISAPSGPFSLGLHPSCVPPMQPQSPSHGPAFSSGVYMGQQHGQGKMPFSSLQQQQHGYEGFGGNPNHQMMSYPGAIAPNYSSSSPVGGGNPFD